MHARFPSEVLELVLYVRKPRQSQGLKLATCFLAALPYLWKRSFSFLVAAWESPSRPFSSARGNRFHTPSIYRAHALLSRKAEELLSFVPGRRFFTKRGGLVRVSEPGQGPPLLSG
jgi:hypothetical protein